MTLRISWSQLRQHETCKERGWHIRQGRRATQENQRVYFPGTVTDRVVRDWLVNDPEHTPGAMPQMVAEVLEREAQTVKEEGGVVAWKSASDRKQVIADCTEAVTKIEPALLKYVVPFRFDADFRFQVPLNVPHPQGGQEKILLIGAMDIIVQDNHDRFWVWDVKHTRDNSYWRKTEGQLTFYSLAVEMMQGQAPVRAGLLQPLCTERVKPFEVTSDKRAQMLQRIAGMARDIWTDEHPPRQDTKECGWCATKHACSKFQPVLDEAGRRRVSLI